MLFPTIEFALFFIIVFILYWSLRKQVLLRKIILVVASYFFYGYWDWRFLFLLFGASFINWLAAEIIQKNSDSKSRQKTALALAVIINLGVLFFYKYFNFFCRNVNNLFFSLGAENSPLPFANIILPVGISFFTFQALSYSIDVYRGHIKERHSLLDVMLYISFFPQLVAGPIVRADHFIPQLKKEPSINKIDAGPALIKIMFGLFKKIVIANYLGTLLVDKVFLDPTSFGSMEMVIAVYGYAMQIFCDFSAYSDIAIGVAALLGFHFPENFNKPYRALSLQEFWRRWHISLSSWLRDYLYIPLGGNKKGKGRTYINLILTMLLGGFWHGAEWNFLIWGAFHGVGQAIGKLIKTNRNEGKSKLLKLAAPFRFLFMFNFVCIGWIFFRAQGFNSAMNIFQVIFSGAESTNGILTPFILFLLFGSLALQFFPDKWDDKIKSVYSRFPIVVQGIIFGLWLIMLQILKPDGVMPFIYFQF